MLLILNGHLVPAHTVSNKFMVRSGNIFSRLVDSCILLAQMPNGRHSVKFVTGEIWVSIVCMLPFVFQILSFDFAICMIWETLWSLWWTSVGICSYSIFLGTLWVQVGFLSLCFMHFGLLDVLFGWVFHSDSVFKSDGYFWLWWWWTTTTTTTTTLWWNNNQQMHYVNAIYIFLVCF